MQIVIKPVYEALSKEELLQRCLGGYTQNSNKSYNRKILRIAPKSTSGSFRITEIAAYMAAGDGAEIYLEILNAMGVPIGRNAYDYCQKEDATRLSNARIKTQQATKETRIARKQKKLQLHMQQEAQEGTFYGSGIADL